MDNKVTILQKLKRFRFIFLGIFFGTLYWIVETSIHVYLLNEGAFFEQLLFPEFHDTWTRSLMGAMIMIFSIFVQLSVNKREKTERALMESEERYRTMVETINDWIWEVDAEGKYTYVSPRIEHILGHKPEELLGKTPFDFMPPDEAERIGKIFQKIVGGQMPFDGLENVNIHNNGSQVIFETSGVPIFNGQGEFIGYRGVDRDITERKKMENKLKEHMSELERFNKLTVGRELKMVELKQEINELLLSIGQQERYSIPSTEGIKNLVEG